MGEAFIVRRGGGGGGGLKLRVKAYPTGTDISAVSGTDGLVAVITNTAITSWAVSATEPSTPAEGMVRIAVDNASNEINVLSKNVLNVYPSSAEQYVEGAWHTVDAHICKDGEWVQFSSARIFIFQEGVGISAGVTVTHTAFFTQSGYTAGSDSMDESQITLASAKGKFGAVGLNIDVSNRKNLYFDQTTHKGTSAQAALALLRGSTLGLNLAYYTKVWSEPLSDGIRSTKIYDVSNSSGVYRFVWRVEDGCTSYIHNIWLE